jgi:hypothetical protein
MKVQRLSDKRVFYAIGVPEDRNQPVVPCCLIGQLEAVDDTTGTLWAYTEEGRIPAEPGDAIVHDGARVVAVLKGEAKGWKPVKDAAPAS